MGLDSFTYIRDIIIARELKPTLLVFHPFGQTNVQAWRGRIMNVLLLYPNSCGGTSAPLSTWDCMGILSPNEPGSGAVYRPVVTPPLLFYVSFFTPSKEKRNRRVWLQGGSAFPLSENENPLTNARGALRGTNARPPLREFFQSKTNARAPLRGFFRKPGSTAPKTRLESAFWEFTENSVIHKNKGQIKQKPVLSVLEYNRNSELSEL